MFPKLLIAVMILHGNLGQRDPFSLPEGKPGTNQGQLPKWPCCQQYEIQIWNNAKNALTYKYRPGT